MTMTSEQAFRIVCGHDVEGWTPVTQPEVEDSDRKFEYMKQVFMYNTGEHYLFQWNEPKSEDVWNDKDIAFDYNNTYSPVQVILKKTTTEEWTPV